MPACSRCRGVAWVRSLAVQRDLARGGGPQPHQRLAQLGLPVALHPGHAQDLARPDLEGHPVHPDPAGLVGHGQVGHVEHHVAGLGRLLADPELHVPADHERGELVLGGGRRPLADHRTAAQHGDRVGDGLDFLELVRDEDDRRAAVLELPDDPEQVLGLRRGQHGGGLVEDQHGRLPDQCLDDLDPLLDADRQVLHQGVRVYLQAVAVGELAHVLARLAPVEQAGAAGLLDAEGHVLRDGEHGYQHEVLVHHADAGRDGVLGRVELGPPCRRARSRPRRAAAARTARSSGWSCPRRSRRAGRAPDPGPPTDRYGRWPPANRNAW